MTFYVGLFLEEEEMHFSSQKRGKRCLNFSRASRPQIASDGGNYLC
jgi:hypothetical protein